MLLSSHQNNGIGWPDSERDFSDNQSDIDIDISGIDQNTINNVPKNPNLAGQEPEVRDNLVKNPNLDGQEPEVGDSLGNHQDDAEQNITDSVCGESMSSSSLPSYYEMDSYGIEVIDSVQNVRDSIPNNREIQNVRDSIPNNQEMITENSDQYNSDIELGVGPKQIYVYTNNIDQDDDLPSDEKESGYINIMNEEGVDIEDRYRKIYEMGYNVPENMYNNTFDNVRIIQRIVIRSVDHWDNLRRGLSHRLADEVYGLHIMVGNFRGIETQIMRRLQESNNTKYWLLESIHRDR